jgi:hypothetical protein
VLMAAALTDAPDQFRRQPGASLDGPRHHCVDSHALTVHAGPP